METPITKNPGLNLLVIFGALGAVLLGLTVFVIIIFIPKDKDTIPPNTLTTTSILHQQVDPTKAFMEKYQGLLTTLSGLSEDPDGSLNIHSLDESTMNTLAHFDQKELQNAPKDVQPKLEKAKKACELKLAKEILDKAKSEKDLKDLPKSQQDLIKRASHEHPEEFDKDKLKQFQQACPDTPEDRLIKALQAPKGIKFIELYRDHQVTLESFKNNKTKVDAVSPRALQDILNGALQKLDTYKKYIALVSTQNELPLAENATMDVYKAIQKSADDFGVYDGDLTLLSDLIKYEPLATSASKSLDDLKKDAVAWNLFDPLIDDATIDKLRMSIVIKDKLKALLKAKALGKPKKTIDELCALTGDVSAYATEISEALKTANPIKKSELEKIQKEVGLCKAVSDLATLSIKTMKSHPDELSFLETVVEPKTLRCSESNQNKVKDLIAMLKIQKQILAYLAKPRGAAPTAEEVAAFKAIGTQLSEYDLESKATEIADFNSAQDVDAFATTFKVLLNFVKTGDKTLTDVMAGPEKTDLLDLLGRSGFNFSLADKTSGATGDDLSRRIITLIDLVAKNAQVQDLLTKAATTTSLPADQLALLESVAADVSRYGFADSSQIQRLITKVKSMPELTEFLKRDATEHTWANIKTAPVAVKEQLVRISPAEITAKFASQEATIKSLRLEYLKELLPQFEDPKIIIDTDNTLNRELLELAKADHLGDPTDAIKIDEALKFYDATKFEALWSASLDTFLKTKAVDPDFDTKKKVCKNYYQVMKKLDATKLGANKDAPDFESFVLEQVDLLINNRRSEVATYYDAANSVAGDLTTPTPGKDTTLKERYAKDSLAKCVNTFVIPYTDLKSQFKTLLTDPNKFHLADISSINKLAEGIANDRKASIPTLDNDPDFKFAPNTAPTIRSIIDEACEQIIDNFQPLSDAFFAALDAYRPGPDASLSDARKILDLIKFMKCHKGTKVIPAPFDIINSSDDDFIMAQLEIVDFGEFSKCVKSNLKLSNQDEWGTKLSTCNAALKKSFADHGVNNAPIQRMTNQLADDALVLNYVVAHILDWEVAKSFVLLKVAKIYDLSSSSFDKAQLKSEIGSLIDQLTNATARIPNGGDTVTVLNIPNIRFAANSKVTDVQCLIADSFIPIVVDKFCNELERLLPGPIKLINDFSQSSWDRIEEILPHISKSEYIPLKNGNLSTLKQVAYDRIANKVQDMYLEGTIDDMNKLPDKTCNLWFWASTKISSINPTTSFRNCLNHTDMLKYFRFVRFNRQFDAFINSLKGKANINEVLDKFDFKRDIEGFEKLQPITLPPGITNQSFTMLLHTLSLKDITDHRELHKYYVNFQTNKLLESITTNLLDETYSLDQPLTDWQAFINGYSDNVYVSIDPDRRSIKKRLDLYTFYLKHNLWNLMATAGPDSIDLNTEYNNQDSLIEFFKEFILRMDIRSIHRVKPALERFAVCLQRMFLKNSRLVVFKNDLEIKAYVIDVKKGKETTDNQTNPIYISTDSSLTTPFATADKTKLKPKVYPFSKYKDTRAAVFLPLTQHNFTFIVFDGKSPPDPSNPITVTRTTPHSNSLVDPF